ncbi:MAG: M1 family metallopeptidase [Flavobacterium sp.]|nr:M1 family metallopeptidase [Flavobacterium sp.]
MFLRFGFLLFSALVFAQNTTAVNFTSCQSMLEINPVKRNVTGDVTYQFTVKSTVDSIRIDAQKMEFSQVLLNGKPVPFKNNNKQFILYQGYQLGENTLQLHYEAFPTQTMYFVNWDFSPKVQTPEQVQGQIWTQGQGKYTSHWLPSFDDPNEKVIFSTTVRFQKSFTVVSNGQLIQQKSIGDDIEWQYQMTQPMSSYLVALAIGHYQKRTLFSKNGVPLEQYYEAEDAARIEPTYRYSKQIMDYLTKEIGVKYPWKIYRQVPVRDFLYAGMENTTTTIFSREYLVDSVGFNDRNYVNVNAHELAHQWFGDLVTAQSGKDHWLQEGFATYYALLAEKEIFGADYFYNKLFQSAQQLIQAAKTDSIPVLNPKASTLSFYQKGAWALHVIRENIGAKAFQKAVKSYLKKYQYTNVITANFLAEVNKVAPQFNTQSFQRRWLESVEFPREEAFVLLRKNKTMEQYLQLRNRPIALTQRDSLMYWMNGKFAAPLKELLLYQQKNARFEDREFLLQAALKTDDVAVRQTVAATTTEFPESFRTTFETLMDDPSYETQEMALYTLWKNAPSDRERYLEKYKNRIGFLNKNLRLAYLNLAYMQATDVQQKSVFYRELLHYTSTNYDSDLQQNALNVLLNLNLKTPEVLKSLVYASSSHRWQFVKFAKDKLRELIKQDEYKTTLEGFIPSLPIREKTQLQRLLVEGKSL